MRLAHYLLCLASRHERAKEHYEEEWRKYRQHEHTKKRKLYTPTYDDEISLLKDLVASIRPKPACLRTLSLPALGVLSYMVKASVDNNPFIEGHEIVGKLVSDPEKTIIYLKSFAELKNKGWLRLNNMVGLALIDEPPFSWLQSNLTLGDTFHGEMGPDCRAFVSNDAYLEAVYCYLQSLISERFIYQITDPCTDFANQEPEGWFRRIGPRVLDTDCLLPAVEVRKKYRLTVFQYLALVGLLGFKDGDLTYEFTDPHAVVALFSRGKQCRDLMKVHLFGEKSNLRRQRLVIARKSSNGERIQITTAAITALMGKRQTVNIKERIKSSSLFEVEEPKVKKNALMVAPHVMEALRSLIFSESRQGRKVRKSWQVALPAVWGSPTGSTVLLYGPPGTGKTLTAQYLASELKLPLIKVDAARILSCWVGESEQNVRRIFDDYASIQHELGIAPVLLLNEADQLLGSRDAGTTAVDRMGNAMQNLFLEGLERFSGILVATTNRRDLLDDAFSRRFTYKLELPPPDQALRIELWKSHLPQHRLAPDVSIEQLADLNLTGGEIRLVVERTVRLLAYRGLTTIDHRTITNIAREELSVRLKQSGLNRIGF
jgi:AAA+ superfamily predicted ATPase